MACGYWEVCVPSVWSVRARVCVCVCVCGSGPSAQLWVHGPSAMLLGVAFTSVPSPHFCLPHCPGASFSMSFLWRRCLFGSCPGAPMRHCTTQDEGGGGRETSLLSGAMPQLPNKWHVQRPSHLSLSAFACIFAFGCGKRTLRQGQNHRRYGWSHKPFFLGPFAFGLHCGMDPL